MARAKNSIDIFADIEYFGCGCEAIVDPKTGVSKSEKQCKKHKLIQYAMGHLR